MMKSVFFILGCLLRTSVTIPMEFHAFSEENQKGQSLRLTETQPDITCAVNLMGGYNSRCLIGGWVYTNVDTPIDVLPPFFDSMDCRNPREDYRKISGVFRVGPADTSTPAIAFYHKGTVTMIEKTTEEHLFFNQSVIPTTYVCTTGSTEWMLFSEQKFVGTSLCFGSKTKQVHCSRADDGTFIGLPPIGSVIRGCDNTN